MTPGEKRRANRERAYEAHTREHFDLFRACYEKACQQARGRTAKLMERDKERYRSRDFVAVLATGVARRMVTAIVKHHQWELDDAERWLEQLHHSPPGEPYTARWIVNEARKRRVRAHWAKMGGLKPGTRL
jgi:hypothetical protein